MYRILFVSNNADARKMLRTCLLQTLTQRFGLNRVKMDICTYADVPLQVGKRPPAQMVYIDIDPDASSPTLTHILGRINSWKPRPLILGCYPFQAPRMAETAEKKGIKKVMLYPEVKWNDHEFIQRHLNEALNSHLSVRVRQPQAEPVVA